MSTNGDAVSGAAPEELFEIQRRGYDRLQVEEFVARSRREAAEQQERLARALGEVEQFRRAAAARPAHEDVPEWIAQILKLAADEAAARAERAAGEMAALRARAEQDADARRAEASGQAERMLAAARDQAGRATAAARAEAEKTVKAAQAEAARALAEGREQAAAATSTAAALARQMLDEATARTAAIRGGAETRLGELVSGHAQTILQLTEVRAVLGGLLAEDGAQSTLEDQVAQTAAATLAAAAGSEQPARTPAGTGEASAADGSTAGPPPGARPGPARIGKEHAGGQYVVQSASGQGAGPR